MSNKPIQPLSQSAATEQGHIVQHLVVTRGDVLFNEPDEKIEYIVEGVLEDESFNAIYGPPDAGKSMTTLELALKVCSDKPQTWLGRKVQKRGSVLYIRYEGSRRRFKARFKKLSRSIGLTAEEMHRFYNVEKPATLDELAAEVNRVCSECRPVLIVVDSLASSHDREENSNTDMKELSRLLQGLMSVYHAAVLVIHHSRKDSQEKPMTLDNLRGAYITSAVEGSLEFRKDQRNRSERFWKWTKLRDGADEDQGCEAGTFNPETFITTSTGSTNEFSHLKGEEVKQEPNFSQYFQGVSVSGLSRKALVHAIEDTEGLKQAGAYRRVTNALRDGILVQNPTTDVLTLAQGVE